MWLYKMVRALVPILLGTFFRIRRHDREKMPTEGPYLLVCNHISNLDPIVMMSMTTRALNFMAKAELFTTTPPLTWAAKKMRAFPINRGEADLSGIRTALGILKKGEPLVIFPEGTRRKGGSGPMLPFHEGVALLALKGKARVIPVCVTGRYRFLHGIDIRVGDPVDLSGFDARRTDKESLEACTLHIRDAINRVGGLEDAPPAEM